MSLYLCIFENDIDDQELDGVEVGAYSDFHDFRVAVNQRLEHGAWGSRFPILMNHHGSDGQWSPGEARRLMREFITIREGFASAPAGAGPFLDVDGVPLIDRLIGLAALSAAEERPIVFQ